MVTKKGEKEGWGSFGVLLSFGFFLLGIFFFFFFPCLTPGPPQRDFLSAAAFEVDLSWLVGFVLL